MRLASPGLLENYMTTGVAQGPTQLGNGAFFSLLVYTGPATLPSPPTVIALVGADSDTSKKVQQFLILEDDVGNDLELQDPQVAGGIAVNPVPSLGGITSVYVSDNIDGEGVVLRYEVDTGTKLPAAPVWLEQKQRLAMKGLDDESVLASGLYFEHLTRTSVGFAVEKPPGCSTTLGLGQGRLWVVEYREPEEQSGCIACRIQHESPAKAYRYRVVANGHVSSRKPETGIKVPLHTKGIAFGADFVMPFMAFLRCKDSFAYHCRIEFVYHPLFSATAKHCVLPTASWHGKEVGVNTGAAGAQNDKGVFYTFPVPKSAVSLGRTVDDRGGEELVVAFNGASSKRLERMTLINGDKEDSFFRIRVPVLNNTKGGVQR